MPAHNHTVACNNEAANSARPGGQVPGPAGGNTIYSNAGDGNTMNAQTIGQAGGNQPHNNMQPYLVINFIIALEGIFPSRN